MRRRLSTLILVAPLCAAFTSANPPNLAPHARVSADSEYSGDYLAAWAVDEKVPALECKQDLKQAWCVKGARGMHGSFTLAWKAPVAVAEIVYFGRTGQIIEECFKDYEVYVDDHPAPVTKGSLAMRHGAQRIPIPKQTVKTIRLKFLNAHPGAVNPGASEIAVYAASPSREQLLAFSVPPEERTPGARRLRESLMRGTLGIDEILVVKRKPMNISHVYVYHVEGYQPGGGLYRYRPVTGTMTSIVDSPDGMISTADLSYDGRRVVFAWKKGGIQRCNPVAMLEDVDRSDPKNNYQIYTVNIDGSDLRQLTTDASNNLDPAWLPDGGITFISDRKPAYAYCYVVTSPVVYRMNRDGGEQKRLSANYLMDFTPSVLNDGRIIYTRWEYVDRAACPIQSLWTLNPDGTGLSGFYGNRVISPGTFMDAQPIPGSRKVIATATNHNGPCRGAIVLIDPEKGANAPEAVENLTPEVNIYAHRIGGGPWGNGMLDCRIGGTYEKPSAVDGRHFLCTKAGAIQLRDVDANAVTLLHPKDGMGFYCAQPIRETPAPPRVGGVRMDESARLREDGGVTGGWATLFLRDVYNGLEPHVKRGEIKRIAVVQEMEKSTHSPQNNVCLDGKGMRNIAVFGFQFPLVSCGATYAPKQLWGFADVKEDGSAAFNVPAEVPIYFLALDAEGRAVQRMRSFTHLMPGEVQGCTGCHADRNSVAPTIDERPFNRRPAQELTRPDWGVAGFRYDQVVQPVWDRHCIECHHPKDPQGNIDLTGDKTDFFSVSYDILTRRGTQGEWNWRKHGSPSGKEYDNVRGTSPHTSWIWTINGAGHNVLEVEPRRWGSPASPLADLIRRGHPDETGKPRVNVPDADRRRVYTWIDLNVPYYGTSSSNHKRRLGSRRMYPYELDGVLKEVGSRRCVSCHEQGVPREFYTRMLNPENNRFLLAPLAKAAGGIELCGAPVFASKDDPDYRKILEVFKPIQDLLKEVPRADMMAYRPN